MKQIYRAWDSAQKVICGGKTCNSQFSVYRGLMQGGAFGEQSRGFARNPSTFCHKKQWRITVEDLNPENDHETRLRRSLRSATEREKN